MKRGHRFPTCRSRYYRSRCSLNYRTSHCLSSNNHTKILNISFLLHLSQGENPIVAEDAWIFSTSKLSLHCSLDPYHRTPTLQLRTLGVLLCPSCHQKRFCFSRLTQPWIPSPSYEQLPRLPRRLRTPGGISWGGGGWSAKGWAARNQGAQGKGKSWLGRCQRIETRTSFIRAVWLAVNPD
ncbi:hypothetical protein N431DRAFT_153208 [Stipitochalara longipes BDJ]|nr:hypothetical protein N431DRAFT_153208 [Stipitochalara longipes BDJ]